MTTEDQEQTYPEELLICVDTDDNITGHATKEKCHKGQGLLHRAFSIYIFNDQKQLLLQKRSQEKLLWPLYWSNSVCSHPRKDESYLIATTRRLKEELGIETELKFLFKFHYTSVYKNIGTENELCSVYVGKTRQAIRPNSSEIAEWKYTDLKYLGLELQNSPESFTPWFKEAWRRVLQHHLTDIERL